jgi:hypothetical protein
VQAKDDPSTGNAVGPSTKLLGGKDVLYTGKVRIVPTTRPRANDSEILMRW